MDLIRAGASTYAQILFGRDPWVGLLLLAASWMDPWVGLHGVVAVAVAVATAAVLGLPPEPTREGLFSYNALLAGLGVGALLPAGWGTVAVLVVGAVTTVVATAALRDATLRTGLPVLTGPFLVVLWLAWALAPSLGVPPVVELGPDRGLPGGLAQILRILGGLLFVPRVEAGLLVALALLRWSRQGAVFAGVGAAVALGLIALLPLPPDPALPGLIGLNLGLVGIALGGVWFVPSWSSASLAAAGAAVAGLLTVGLQPLAVRLGLPLFIVPFNLTVWAFLLATRQRSSDRAPKSVDFLPGTPEENLRYYQTRLARFGAHYLVRLRAPVRGIWQITQARGDGPTHQGAWAQAIDLEVAGPDGSFSRGTGARPQDHLCWHLPVLACADGIVARVIDGVPDNAIGEVDLDDNWGNVVVLWHGPGLHSLVAHLSPGTVTVVEGQRVRRGEVLGLCGSSGRSPRPHVHFQLQASAAVGAATLPLELHDVVEEGPAGPTLRGRWTPGTGDQLRNLVPDEDLADVLGWLPGRTLALRLEGGSTHEIVPEIDPLGRRVLRCGGGRLFYGIEDDLITVFDTLAPRGSVLHVLHAALPRLPLEDGERGPVWSDHLPLRSLSAWWLRPLHDVIAPFRGHRGHEVRYQMVRVGRDRVIEGRSVAVQGQTPWIVTRAVLRPGVGLVEASLSLRGQAVRVTRVPADPDQIETSKERGDR